MGGTARILSISSTLIFRSPLLQFSSKRLLSISIPLTRRVFQGFRPICSSATATTTTSAVESDSQGSSPAADKHSIIKDGGGALNTTQQAKPRNPSKNLGRNDETQNLDSDFKKLGLSEEVLAALGEMCILVPTEIQSIGIPAVLQGKSVVLGSHTGSGKTLAYLIPIVELLRRDELESGIQMKFMRPRAIILCPTRELSEQVFHVAKSISHHARFGFTMVSDGGQLRPQEDSLNIPIDMVVGTPGRILQHIEDGDLVFGDIRYLVLDEADTMFDHGFGPEIHKFLDLLKNRAAKPNDTGIQTVLVAATMTKDVQELIDEEFKGISHLQTSSLHKKVSSARHDFLKLSSSENKLEVLLQVCSENNMVDAAYDLIERMEGHSLNLNEETYYVLIHGLVSASRVDKALQLFEKMHSCGVLADVRMYDVLIGGLCKNNELDKALSLYSDMKSSGVSPNVGILTNLISSSSEQQMVQLFEDSREYLGTEAFLTLCDSILSSLVKNGLINKAYNLLRIITEKLFNVEGIVWSKFTFFHTVMAGLCKYGKLDAALGLLRDLDKIPCEKDVTLYNDLISALSNSNRVDDCFELLREMKHLQMQPTHFTYNSIYLYFCRKSDVGGALDLVKEMRIYGHSPWIKHTTLLMKNLCNHGRALEACNFLSDIVKEGARPDIVPFSVVLEGLLKLQRLDHAVEFFKDMCSHGKRPDVIAYNILIKGFCKAKRMSEAEDTFTEMLENGLVPSTITYNSLIDGWCKNGNIEKALLCLKSIGEGVPNVVTYTTLIDGLSNVGLPDDAVSLWDEMQRKGCSPNRIAFMALINGLCKNGRPTAALNYLRQMNEMKLRADGFIYIALLSSFISKENASLAYDVLEEMVDKEIIPKPEDKNHALLEDAILKLYGDPRTSSDVHSLLASGAIPTISLTELQKRSEPLT